MKIKQLSERIIKQIAAGEVIARPMNAIKELIENAIDANATQITLYIEKNGLEKIILIDNGHGMQIEDLKICTKLHTTSKTSEDDKMFGAYTLGFRGEALASISAISNLIIETNGYKFENETISPSNITIGTRVEIQNMFANVPARLKFIKSISTEWLYINQMIQKFIIKYPNIAWSLYNNQKKIYHFNANETTEYRIEKLFNCKFKPFKYEYNNTKIYGYLLEKSSKFNITFINNRAIADKAIVKYLNNIFNEYYMKNEAPGYILNIDLDPFFIDCNVHPAKQEVRLINYQDIFRMLSFIFDQNFFKTQNMPQADHLKFITHESTNNININEISKNETEKNFSRPIELEYELKTYNQESNYLNEARQLYQDSTILDANTNIKFSSSYKIIGQIKNSFILFETQEGIGIFDQHAAHERHVYEKMKRELNKNSAQALLIPIKLNLTNTQSEYINSYKEIFENKGIIINDGYLTHIPSLFYANNFAHFIENELEENTACEILIDRILADVACKNALKANTQISHEQMLSLLELALENVPICNHGRPVFKYFTLSEIENWFKRR